MRCAFFGGSFDPPHAGHLHIAHEAAQRLSLDQVLLAPVGRQPLKSQDATSFPDRLAMVELLVAGEPRFVASAIDAPRGEPNYTSETLPKLWNTLPPDTELFLLAGADSFLTLPHWREPQRLLDPREHGGLLKGWILAARPGFPLDELGRALPTGYRLKLAQPAAEKVLTYHMTDRHENPAVPLHILADLDDPATATRIREALRQGVRAPHLLPSVASYIADRALYRVLG